MVTLTQYLPFNNIKLLRGTLVDEIIVLFGYITRISKTGGSSERELALNSNDTLNTPGEMERKLPEN